MSFTPSCTEPNAGCTASQSETNIETNVLEGSHKLVDVNSVSFRYPSIGNDAVHDVSFCLHSGDRVLLIGHNGSGKSTLLSLIAGKHAPQSGSVRVMDRDPFNETNMAKHITLIGPPWPAQAYFASTVERVTSPTEFVQRRNQFARELHLPLKASIDKMSSGEKRRTQILHGLIEPSTVYLLDECSTDIDVAERQTLLKIVDRDCTAHNGCCIYATHILDHVQHWATHIMLFDKGEMKAFVAISELIMSVEEFALQAMQKTAAYLPFSSPVVYSPSSLQQREALSNVQKSEREEAEDKTLAQCTLENEQTTQGKKPYLQSNVYWTHEPIIVNKTSKTGVVSKLSYSSEVVISCTDLTYKHIFDKLNFTVHRGERVLLCGCNGSGKTTLLNMLGGKQFFDNSNNAMTVFSIPCYADMSLNALVAYGGDWWTCVPGGEVHVREMLTLHDARARYLRDLLAVDLDWDVRQLSSGELKRVQLLFHLLHDKPVVLLDEATTDLDVDQRHHLLQFLYEESVQRGVTVIYSTHIFGGLSGWANVMMLLDRTQRRICKTWREYCGDAIDLEKLTDELILLKANEKFEEALSNLN